MTSVETKIGQVYSIALRQIVPPYEPSGYYGVCRIVRMEAKGVVLAALDWVGTVVPKLPTVEHGTVLRLSQGPFAGQAAVYWEAGAPIAGVEYLGASSPSAEELELTTCRCQGRTCTCRHFLGGWKACRAALNQEWHKRLSPDKFAVDREWLAGVSQAQYQQVAEKRQAELTPAGLEGFRQEVLFPNWEGYLAPEIVRESRQLFQVTLHKLDELGANASRAEKESLLKECIEGFNHLNRKYAAFIATPEREAICHEFSRLVRLAGIDDPELADRWREW